VRLWLCLGHRLPWRRHAQDRGQRRCRQHADPNGLRYNVRRLADYSALSAHMLELYRPTSIAQTVAHWQVRPHDDEPELPINLNIVPASAVAH
jgi:hypothetical protein